jgi:hypothetical protein
MWGTIYLPTHLKAIDMVYLQNWTNDKSLIEIVEQKHGKNLKFPKTDQRSRLPCPHGWSKSRLEFET